MSGVQEQNLDMSDSASVRYSKNASKRLMDLTLLLAFAPFVLPLYIAIIFFLLGEQLLTRDFGPIMLGEIRISKERQFRLFKLNIFKEYVRQDYISSPTYQTAESYHPLQRDPNSLRWVGRFMTKYYFDELGQFFNILLGDMSFVGPRPRHVSAPQNKRPPWLHLKPGFFGFHHNHWKNGGDTILKYKSDEEYLELFNKSSVLALVKLDTLIVIDGLRAVVKGKGL